MAHLVMFYGRECPHCKKMLPLIEKLEQETPIRIEKHEVWHDEKNADLMRGLAEAIAPKCGHQLRVPTFVNMETKDAMCGEVDFEKLKDWALKQA